MNKIKKLRKEQGLTQTELARKVGVSIKTIYLWENEVQDPSEDNLEKLKELLKDE